MGSTLVLCEDSSLQSIWDLMDEHWGGQEPEEEEPEIGAEADPYCEHSPEHSADSEVVADAAQNPEPKGPPSAEPQAPALQHQQSLEAETLILGAATPKDSVTTPPRDARLKADELEDEEPLPRHATTPEVLLWAHRKKVRNLESGAQ